MELDRSPVPDFRDRLGLAGRAAIVLGGGNGIGRQTCHALAQAGARIVCVDTDPGRAAAVAEETAGIALTGDITSRSEIERLFAEAAAKAGPVSVAVDIVGMPVLGPLATLDDAGWARQFDLVLTHAFLTLQVGGRVLAEAGGGAMVFVGSIAGITGLPGQTAYGAAKAALHHLVSCAAVELGPAGVRVNAVAPGRIRTPRLNAVVDEERWRRFGEIIPRGSAGTPDEIAGPILFLASPLSAYLTGQILVADGGLTSAVSAPGLW